MGMLKLVRISGHTFIGSVLDDSSFILDLGANHGNFSREIALRFGCKTIVAVEPPPYLATQLSKVNGLGVRQCVVNEFGEQARFRIDSDNSESSSIARGAGDNNCLVVAGITLTELIGEHLVVDLVKVDVEGAEIGILRSAPEDVLQRVRQFTVEFHDFKEGSGVDKTDVQTVFDRMRGLGFKVFVNSFWNFADVLFVNTAFIPIAERDVVSLTISGRWLPGMKRVASRLRVGAS